MGDVGGCVDQQGAAALHSFHLRGIWVVMGVGCGVQTFILALSCMHAEVVLKEKWVSTNSTVVTIY